MCGTSDNVQIWNWQTAELVRAFGTEACAMQLVSSSQANASSLLITGNRGHDVSMWNLDAPTAVAVARYKKMTHFAFLNSHTIKAIE